MGGWVRSSSLGGPLEVGVGETGRQLQGLSAGPTSFSLLCLACSLSSSPWQAGRAGLESGERRGHRLAELRSDTFNLLLLPLVVPELMVLLHHPGGQAREIRNTREKLASARHTRGRIE